MSPRDRWSGLPASVRASIQVGSAVGSVLVVILGAVGLSGHTRSAEPDRATAATVARNTGRLDTLTVQFQGFRDQYARDRADDGRTRDYTICSLRALQNKPHEDCETILLPGRDR